MAVLSYLLLSQAYQGRHPAEHREAQFIVNIVFLISIFVLSGLGAFLGVFLLRGRHLSYRSVLIPAVLFAMASFYVVVFALGHGGPIAVAVWLVVGAAAFAAGAVLFDPRVIKTA